MLGIFILIVFIAGTLIGFVLGKFSERLAWNRLIERGILPKPKNAKKKTDFDLYEGEDF